uniref:Uncharacterized protein n=1 Tax=Rhizophora mucronata TaxID=61149 RepID=A0A2P2MZW4_RHIMU
MNINKIHQLFAACKIQRIENSTFVKLQRLFSKEIRIASCFTYAESVLFSLS